VPAEDAWRPPAAFAGSPAAMLARGAEPPGTPAIGGGGRVSGFGVEAGSAGFAGSPAAMWVRGNPLQPPAPAARAVGGGGRVSGFGVDAGSAGFAGSPSAVLAREDDCPEPPRSPELPRLVVAVGCLDSVLMRVRLGSPVGFMR